MKLLLRGFWRRGWLGRRLALQFDQDEVERSITGIFRQVHAGRGVLSLACFGLETLRFAAGKVNCPLASLRNTATLSG